MVIYDKFHIQYPNYLKDINVCNFMSKYLNIKQNYLDRIKETNNSNYIQTKIKKGQIYSLSFMFL